MHRSVYEALTAAVDHDAGVLNRAGLEKSLGGLLNGLFVEVCPFSAASKYDVQVGIASRLDYGSESLRCYTHKRMGFRGRAHCIH
jgi:hypothetical protein